MAAREGMAVNIATLRGMTNAGTADYTINSVSYWDDDEMQRVLDRHRLDIRRSELLPVQSYESGTVVYKEYLSGRVNLESGTAVFEIETGTGTTLGTASYTMDYVRGVTTFPTNTAGSVFYMNARTYDLNAAAADVWKQKAAQVANLVDFSTDNHRINRSDLREGYLEMAEYYSALSVPVTVKMVRDDLP